MQNQAEQDVAVTNKKEQPDAVATVAGVVCVCVGARGERRRERAKGGRVYRRRIGRLSGCVNVGVWGEGRESERESERGRGRYCHIPQISDAAATNKKGAAGCRGHRCRCCVRVRIKAGLNAIKAEIHI